MSDHRPQVAIVTGASRGAGKGIAIGLGSRGMTVYVTGREKSESGGRMLGRDLPGTLEETATAVTRAGGKGIGVVCDSARDDELRALVERVTRETGRLDILHNNATFIHDRLVEPGPFWEKPLEFVRIIDVGLRSAYVASWYAAPVMVRQGSGLISFSSSFGGSTKSLTRSSLSSAAFASNACGSWVSFIACISLSALFSAPASAENAAGARIACARSTLPSRINDSAARVRSSVSCGTSTTAR